MMNPDARPGLINALGITGSNPTEVPPPFTRTGGGDVLLRNSGFTNNVIDTFDRLSLKFAQELFPLKVGGTVLQVLPNVGDTHTRINVYLYSPSFRNPANPPYTDRSPLPGRAELLVQNPHAWTDHFELADGTLVTFEPTGVPVVDLLTKIPDGQQVVLGAPIYNNVEYALQQKPQTKQAPLKGVNEGRIITALSSIASRVINTAKTIKGS